MEMTEDMLKVLTQEGCFTIKGTETEEAVLSTKENSFIVREAPSSNSILLLDAHPLKSRKAESIVVQTLHAFYQLNRTSANVEKLKALLSPTALSFPDFDKPSASKSYTHSDLENQMQCSVGELNSALASLGAVEYQGFYRVLSLEAEYAMAKHVLLTMNAGGMDEQKLYREDVIDQAQDKAFPSDLLAFVVDSYLIPNTDASSTTVSGTSLFTFDVRKYTVLFAHFILRSKKNITWSDLKDSLIEKIPQNFHSAIDISILDGLACTEEQGSETLLSFLPASSLPHNPKIRLAELFKRKPKWTFAQLKPYLQDLLSQDTNEEQILVAHTRSSNGPGGIKLYSSR